MKVKSFQIFVVLVFLAVSMVASASQVILNPSQDACVLSYNPDTNYGDWDHFWVGHAYGGWLDPLIQFSLAPYAGVIVESAYLRLYVFDSAGTFPPTSIWIERVTESWGEMTVTWNNMPGGDDSAYISGPGSVGDWWVIDVASYVNGWVSGTHDNYGFMLGTLDVNDDSFTVYSREYSDPAYRPQLELNYHDVSVQPTSLGSIKAIYK